jgi:protein-disulfide isomerase-like protein with CxxC motif
MIAETVAKTMPVLAKFLTSTSILAGNKEPTGENTKNNSEQTDSVTPTSRGDRFSKTEEETVLPQDLLDLTTKAFLRALSKEKWSELSTNKEYRVLVSVSNDGGRNERGYKKEIWLHKDKGIICL